MSKSQTKTRRPAKRKRRAPARKSGVPDIPSFPPPPPARRGGDLPDVNLRMEAFVLYLRRNWADGFPGIIRADNARAVEIVKALADMHCPKCDRTGTLILALDRPLLLCRVCGNELAFAEAVSEFFRGRVR